jgi:hypothetical protein
MEVYICIENTQRCTNMCIVGIKYILLCRYSINSDTMSLEKLTIGIMREAKKTFSTEYSAKVEELGCHLGHGITEIDGQYAICAYVQSRTTRAPPRSLQQKVDAFLPSSYQFKGYNIVVKKEYMGMAKSYGSTGKTKSYAEATAELAKVPSSRL